MKSLKGSEKQIKWAEDIRKDYIRLVEKYRNLDTKENKSDDEKNHISGLLGVITQGKSVYKLDEIDEKYRGQFIEESKELKEKLGFKDVPTKKLPEKEKEIVRELSRKQKQIKKDEFDAWLNEVIEEKLNYENSKDWIEYELRK